MPFGQPPRSNPTTPATGQITKPHKGGELLVKKGVEKLKIKDGASLNQALMDLQQGNNIVQWVEPNYLLTKTDAHPLTTTSADINKKLFTVNTVNNCRVRRAGDGSKGKALAELINFCSRSSATSHGCEPSSQGASLFISSRSSATSQALVSTQMVKTDDP